METPSKESVTRVYKKLKTLDNFVFAVTPYFKLTDCGLFDAASYENVQLAFVVKS